MISCSNRLSRAPLTMKASSTISSSCSLEFFFCLFLQRPVPPRAVRCASAASHTTRILLVGAIVVVIAPGACLLEALARPCAIMTSRSVVCVRGAASRQFSMADSRTFLREPIHFTKWLHVVEDITANRSRRRARKHFAVNS